MAVSARTAKTLQGGATVEDRGLDQRLASRRGVRRAWVLVTLIVLCGAALGGAWGMHRSESSEARAAILVTPLVGNPFSPEAGGDDLVNLTTEAQLVTSDPVGQLVSDHMPGHPAVADLLSGVRVKVPSNSQVLEISVRHRSAAEAVRRAQAFATTFLGYRVARMQSAVFDRSARIKELIADRTAVMVRDQEVLANVRGDSARALAMREQIVDLTSQISELRTQLAGLEAASRDPGQVITPAARRSSWLPSTTTLGVVGGAVVALVMALALVGARRRSDDRVLVPEDLAALDVPVHGPVGDDMESYRRLRSGLLGAVERRPMVVLLGSMGPRTPVRTVEGLARSLGSAGLEVIVVEARDDRPFVRPAAAGLSELLVDPSLLDDALVDRAPHVLGVDPGRMPAALDDLVDSPETAILFQELRKRADVVLVVAGPTTSTRTESLVRVVDAVLMEVVAGRVGLSQVQAAVDRLTRSGGRLAGLVYLPSGAAGFARRRSSSQPTDA